MMMNLDVTPVRLAGRTLKQTRHVCAFFNSRDEQNKVLMPFFKEGVDKGQKVFHIIIASSSRASAGLLRWRH